MADKSDTTRLYVVVWQDRQTNEIGASGAFVAIEMAAHRYVDREKNQPDRKWAIAVVDAIPSGIEP